MNTLFENAHLFVYRNARPIEIARFRFLFEKGSADDVLTALSAYQNADGGFGHGLEADCWNPESSPMQTWVATCIIRETGVERHPVIDNLIRYLSSGKDFDGHFWYKSLKSNKDYPHAPWWECDDDDNGEGDYNPTASLAGFLVRYAPKGCFSWNLGATICKEAYEALKKGSLPHSMNIVDLDEMRRDLEASGNPIPGLKELLLPIVSGMIEKDCDKWETEYCDLPSWHIQDSECPYLEPNRALAEAEAAFIVRTQLPDGSWPITWHWNAYPDEWAIARNWWKSERLIRNLKFLSALSMLD